jgi:ubiquinone/menaquinone biosynthesis C-methylase UbiE
VPISFVSRSASRLVAASPWIYDRVQAFFGLRQARERLAPYIADACGKRILDVGAGTGLYRSLVPATATYVWVDIDWTKLQGFRRRTPGGLACVGDASRLCFRDQSVDLALCVAVSHHLSDPQLASLFAELARVVRERVVFLDAVESPKSVVSRVLWRLDGGAHPRTAETILTAMRTRLEVEEVQEYQVYHRYLLCTARPKGR